MKAQTRLLTFASALAIAASALAQESKPLNLSIRIGNFQPAVGTARDEGKNWFAIGVDSRFKNLGVSASNPSESSYLTISADVYGKGGFSAIHGLLNYVHRSNELYFSGGAGVAFVEDEGSDAETRLGYAFGVGWDFVQSRTPLFVEAKWFGTSGNNHLSGFGLFLGIRL